MHSELYDGLPSAREGAEKEAADGKKAAGPTWARALMAPASLVARRSAAARGRGRGRGPGPVQRKPRTDAGTPGAGLPEAAAGLAAAPGAPSARGEVQAGRGSHMDLDVEDAYDPYVPNDFMLAKERIEARRLAAEQEAARQEEILAERRRRADEAARRAAETGDGSRKRERAEKLCISGDDAYARRAALSRSAGVGTAPAEAPPPRSGEAAGGSVRGMPLAQRMLEKLGWRQGEGLGVRRQGIVAPLLAVKTAATAGVVVAPIAPNAPRRSRVVLLENLVSQGETSGVDEEVGAECANFGDVESVVTFLVTEPDYPPDAAVRVFVEFRDEAGAEKALQSLSGRFFGGRQVRASLYDETRFAADDFAPVVPDAVV